MKPSTQRILWGPVVLAVLAAIAFQAAPSIARWFGPAGEPAAALPYLAQQVGFDNPASGIRLAGTLTMPRGSGPHRAIVLIPGSGEVDRDGAVLGHRFYQVLADDLTSRGFAVLRSDKRGLGASGGDFARATSYDFASDIQAALAFLRSHPGIDPGRIGLVGHSEGALIGAIVAGRDRKVAFLVMMAGNGIPAGEMSIDPEPLLRRLRCPVLALVGDKDPVVTADANIPALKEALAINPRARVERLPGLNHFFQTARTGEFEEVAAIEETMSPRALALIGRWAKEQ